MADLEPESPLWWVKRLYAALVDRRQRIDVYDSYYRGEHPLPWLAPQAQEDFRRILKMTRANYMGLVVDAQVERLKVSGFRIGDSEGADKATWAIWQANNLDSYSGQAFLEAAIAGQSYLLVGPRRPGRQQPDIWVESPRQAIVEYVPGTNQRERAAGLKVWDDDLTGMVNATLYLPGLLFKFQVAKPKTGYLAPIPDWQPRVIDGESWPASNTLGEVPLIELQNNPRLGIGGVSELHDVIDSQDRANKTIADRLITQDYGAFPQKWASGWPETDADGKPTPPINVGRDRMVTTEVAETRFGQWEAAPLDPYSAAKREDVKDIASRSRTPAQYLLGEMSNVNGETLKASESGLISKVKQRAAALEDGLEDAMRLARRAAGLPDVDDSQMETIWRDPQYRTEGELVDALVKMDTLEVPRVALWERWGASPQEIARWQRLGDEQARRDAARAAVLNPQQPTGPLVVPTGSAVERGDGPGGPAGAVAGA